MKHLFLLILSTLVIFAAHAERKTLKKNNNGLLAATSWSPEGLPINGDELIIPEGTTLVVSGQVSLTNLNVTLIVHGIMNLQNAKLDLGKESSIYLSNASALIDPEGKGNNNKIYIGNDLKYESNSGPISGPAVADKNTSTSSSNSIQESGFVRQMNLPVIFTSFTVSKSSKSVSIKWSTSEEINADVFQVERSEDGKTWRTVGKVKAVGNSNIENNYTFTDNALFSNTAYYRIKQVDIDGKFIYTEVKAVTNRTNLAGTSNNASIIAAGNNIIVNFAKELNGSVVVKLISFGGQVIAQQTFNQPLKQVVFNKTAVNKGNYIVFVSNNLDLTASKQITL